MGHMKVFFRIGVYCRCWGILRFVSDSLFFLPHSLVIFFLLVEAVRELKTEKKKDKDIIKLKF